MTYEVPAHAPPAFPPVSRSQYVPSASAVCTPALHSPSSLFSSTNPAVPARAPFSPKQTYRRSRGDLPRPYATRCVPEDCQLFRSAPVPASALKKGTTRAVAAQRC